MTTLAITLHAIAAQIADAVTSELQIQYSPTEAAERFQELIGSLFPVPPQTPCTASTAPANGHYRGRLPSPEQRKFSPAEIQARFYEHDGRVFYARNTKSGMKAGSEAGNIPMTKPRPQCVVYVDGTRFHRSHIVFCLHHGRWPEYKIFHKNFDSLDDHIENLLEATDSEISRSTKCSSANRLGVKGVAYEPQNGLRPYRTRIVRHGLLVHLGSYSTASEAHFAYCEAANRLHGAFNPSASLYQLLNQDDPSK